MPEGFGFTSGEDARGEEEEKHWTDPSLQTPWTDSGPPSPLTDSPWYDEPFIKEGESWLSPREFYESPFTPEEFFEGRREFGNQFQSAGPLTQERYQRFAGAGFPGVNVSSFSNLPTRNDPMAAPPPAWLSKVYQSNEGDTIGSVVNRARQGVKDWMSGGPNAPRILTPKEWEDLLPSEQEGTLGFLEYIGIYPKDYMEMIKKQQNSVMEAFGIPFQYKPARQR